MQLLSTVEDSFQIEGRGRVITFWMPPNAPVVRRKEAIQLKRSDGILIDTQVEDLEILKRGRIDTDPRECAAFQLSESIIQSDVPRGTEIWLFNE